VSAAGDSPVRFVGDFRREVITMATGPTIVAVTGHERLRPHLLARAETLGRETGASVILFDRDGDLGPLMSTLPTNWSAEGDEDEFGDRLDPHDLEIVGQAALAQQVQSLRDVGLRAYAWLPSKADAKSLAEYASKQGADTVLVSADDHDLVAGLRSTAELTARLEVVPTDGSLETAG
jgi:hypothetical protein